jgi:hypothetical protein
MVRIGPFFKKSTELFGNLIPNYVLWESLMGSLPSFDAFLMLNRKHHDL